MQRIALIVIAACAVATLVHSSAPAIGPLVSCADDRAKFCSDTRPGDGRVVACLRRHQGQLSDACKQGLGIVSGGGSASIPKTACREDAMKLCRAAIGDQAKMKACMQEHAAQLSDGCKTALISRGK